MLVEENKKKLDKTLKSAFVFLLGYISLMPFYYFPSLQLFGMKLPIIKYIPLLLILFVFFVSIITRNFNSKDLRQEKLNSFIALYFFLTLLSGLGAEYYPISILKALYYGLTGILIYFIIFSWELNVEQKGWFLEKIVIFGFIVSLYGILTLILGKDVLFGKLEYSKSHVLDPKIFLEMGRISSSLGSPHFLGSFLSAILPISIYLFFKKSEQAKKSAYVMMIISLLIFLGALLTFSAGAFLGIILSCILYLLKIKSLYGTLFANRITKTILVLGVIVFCVILSMMATNILLNLNKKDYLFGKFFGRIDFHKLANQDGFVYRLDSVKYAFESLRTNALFGKGIGKIGVGDDRIPRITMDNFYCLSIAENGLITFVYMLFIFSLIVNKGLANLKTSVSAEEKKLSYFLIGGIVVFFINMFFWDVFNHPTMRILFWSFVGFLI